MKKAPGSECERLSALGDRPDAWESLTDEDLKHVVMLKCMEYGASQDAARIRGLFALYGYALSHLERTERMQLVTQFSEIVENQRGLGHMGLMMFLFVDDDPGIRSTAAMNLAVLFDPKDGDELTGAKFVVRTLLNQERDAKRQGAALAGVLLLGDKRVLPLLWDAWPNLSDEGRIELSRAKSGVVTEGMIEFWLRCLENGCSESVFGSVVAAIANMPAIAQAPLVVDLERVIPVYRDSENPVKRLCQTSFGDYLEKIRPRLEALEAAESEPKIIPNIYKSWENAEEVRRAFHTDAPSLFRDAEAALPNFTPIRVAPDLLQQCDPTGLFAYGIFNPMGPTISTISVLRHGAVNTSLIHYQMLNPFAQERMVIGALANNASKDELVTLLSRTFAANDLDDSALLMGLPTFLILPEDDDYRTIGLSCLRSHVIENGRLSDVAEQLESLRRYEGKPWDRATSEISRAMELLAANRGGSTVSDTRPIVDENSAAGLLEEWLQFLISPSHLNAELRGVVQAWQGAIDFQGGNFLAKEAMPLEEMLNCVIETNPEFVIQIRKAIQ